ncbi:unnamed protein product [Cunninghamella echinulata]
MEEETSNINTTIVEDDQQNVIMKETMNSEEHSNTESSLEALEAIPTTMEQLAADNTNYELHIKLIDLLKQVEMNEQLESAREAMHDIYPLSEQMWLDWINDTKKEADTEEGESKLRNLYEEAEKDYLSIPIWESYEDFILDKFNTLWNQQEDKQNPELENLIETTREDLLKAVRATTYHVAKSHVIWNKYIEFEINLLESNKSEEQFEKIKKLYLDRLGVLHIACEETFSHYSQFISNHDNNNYETSLVEANKIYSTTKSAAEDRDYFEQYLKDNNYSLDAFYQYIENEKVAKKMKSLNNVRNLYERAISYYCTDVGLWEDYICFMMEDAHVLAFLQPLALRAVRNCPWSGLLWSHLARFMEAANAPQEQIIDLFDRALTNKSLLSSLEDLVSLLLSKCDYFRRSLDWQQIGSDDDDERNEALVDLRVAFEEALAYISEAFPKEGDPYYRIEKYYARMEGKHFRNFEKARQLWEDVIKKHGKNSEAWLNYIEFERSLGTANNTESLFKRAMSKNMDYPERIISAWTSVVHEEGSIASLETSIIRINKKSKLLTRQWQTALAEQEALEEEKKQKEIDKKIKKGAHRKKQKGSKKEKADSIPVVGNKRRLSSEDGSNEDTTNNDNKKARLDTPANNEQQQPNVDKDGFKIPTNMPKPRAISGRGRGGLRRGGRVALGGSMQRNQQQSSSSSSSLPSTSSSDTTKTTTTSHSNDDFRAMLLGKK